MQVGSALAINDDRKVLQLCLVRGRAVLPNILGQIKRTSYHNV
jgi:hypothetical protein